MMPVSYTGIPRMCMTVVTASKREELLMKKLLAVLVFGVMLLYSFEGSASTKVTNTEGGLYVVNCNESISLRSSPSVEASALAQIPLGAAVQVVGNGTHGFAHVSYKGINGYALYDYLTPHATLYRVVNCNEYISLRNAPSTGAATLGIVPLAASVRFVKDAGNGFYYVDYRGTLGFVLSEYLD